MILERIGWTTVGLIVVQEQFAKLRKHENGLWRIKLKSTTLEADSEEELLEKFLVWCKKIEI